MGKYTLLRGLAVGGMAELYLARADGIEGFEKLVALKRILPHYAAQDDFVDMFLDEARLVAALQHHNIAQVHDIGQCPLGLFFTMEFVHGVDVRRLLRTACLQGEHLPLEHVVAIVAGAAAGLHAAHEQTGPEGEPLGIVHRDVSPANLMVSYDGCVKLIDFGVAKASHRQTETRAGCVKGKLAYMSPEQCLGEELDRRSDVFALGIVLFELATNKRLFWDENDFAIMKRIARGRVPRPRDVRPDLPAALEDIILRALRHRPSQRYATAQELQLALERFARDHCLAVSGIALGRYVSEMFADTLEAWEARRGELRHIGAQPASERAPAEHEPSHPAPAGQDEIARLDGAPSRQVSRSISDAIVNVVSQRLSGIDHPVDPAGQARGGTDASRADGSPSQPSGREPSISIDALVLDTLTSAVLELSGQHKLEGDLSGQHMAASELSGKHMVACELSNPHVAANESADAADPRDEAAGGDGAAQAASGGGAGQAADGPRSGSRRSRVALGVAAAVILLAALSRSGGVRQADTAASASPALSALSAVVDATDGARAVDPSTGDPSTGDARPVAERAAARGAVEPEPARPPSEPPARASGSRPDVAVANARAGARADATTGKGAAPRRVRRHTRSSPRHTVRHRPRRQWPRAWDPDAALPPR